MTSPLPYAHGGPLITATLRAEPADFRVDEVLGFEPTGEGEHAFLTVEKTGANTEWVARQLAAAVGVAPMVVGYAGLKDRHAVTRQVFTVQLPGRADPDWQSIAIPGVRVLASTRHNRKLKRGGHRGNRFRIRLRNASGSMDDVSARLATIGACGVPNYFGEQRFGRDNGNLALAEALFAGQRMARPQRGFALSAARSEVFNALLAERVAEATWNRALDGEVWMLDGTHSVFGPEPINDDLTARLAKLDIHPTGPLWGRGSLRSGNAVCAMEQAIASRFASLTQGLEKAGLDQERRALRLKVTQLECERAAEDELVLAFELASGSFATTVLRELCDWHQPDGR